MANKHFILKKKNFKLWGHFKIFNITFFFFRWKCQKYKLNKTVIKQKWKCDKAILILIDINPKKRYRYRPQWASGDSKWPSASKTSTLSEWFSHVQLSAWIESCLV